MDSQNLKQRSTDEPTVTAVDGGDVKLTGKSGRTRPDKRMATAKHGVKSLAAWLLLPTAITFLAIYFFGSNRGEHGTQSKSLWFLPLWVLNTTHVASSLLMGLAAWLVWVDGGFHRKPLGLTLYLAQLGLGLAWYPIVFRLGATWVGLGLSLAKAGGIAGCWKVFKEVNPVAADFVKPCLGWAAFLAVVNVIKLICF